MTAFRLARRRFLVGLGAIGSGGLVGPMAGCSRRSVEALGRLTAPLADSTEAEALGVEYVSRNPSEAQVAQLEAVLLDSLAEARDVDDVVDALHIRMLDDFDRGDTVRLGGWLFSRTELRVYALDALRRQRSRRPPVTGVFPAERRDGERFRWTGPRASVELTPGGEDVRLTLRAMAPLEQSVSVSFDGVHIAHVALSRGEWQVLRYRRPARVSHVQLDVTPTWRPQNDFRTLGVQWNERPPPIRS